MYVEVLRIRRISVGVRAEAASYKMGRGLFFAGVARNVWASRIAADGCVICLVHERGRHNLQARRTVAISIFF